MRRRVVIVGAGAFGLSSALELAGRGWSVVVCDRGPVPHPRASSTDISKAIRSDYGADREMTEMAIEAIDRWRAWNGVAGRPLFHPVGFLALAAAPLAADQFEGDCQRLHRDLGRPVEALDRRDLRRRFPAIDTSIYPEAHFNPNGGWAASSDAVAWLAERAVASGVDLRTGSAVESLLVRDGTVDGVRAAGIEIEADAVVLAAGAWSAGLHPPLARSIRPSGQLVVHFSTDAPSLDDLPVWAADIGRTGWYGFPRDPAGRFKVGLHGEGIQRDLDEPGDHPPAADGAFRDFVRRTFPLAGEAPVGERRICFYADSVDGDFWIDLDPERPGLMVATGGTGHGFKFAPMIGAIVADRLEGRENRWGRRFAWRRDAGPAREQARSGVRLS